MTQEFISPNYGNAPLIEVALSVQFKQKPQFVGAHAGVFWQRIQQIYPIVQEHPLLGPIDELFGSSQMSAIEFQLGPPGSRHWFLSRDGHHLVQLQRDRLALNWRRLSDGVVYPRYSSLVAEFEQLFAQADSFFDEAGMERCQVNMSEVSYINQWFFEKDQKFSDAIGSWLKLAPNNSASLDMETANIAAIYLVHAENGTPIGRLYVNVSPIFSHKGSMGINLELTCRVRPIPGDKPHIGALHLAHQHVVTTFQEITSDSAQRMWRG